MEGGERMEETKTDYICVFRLGVCPVQDRFKLRPESLVAFCTMCPKPKSIETKPVDHRDELLMQALNMAGQKLFNLFEVWDADRKRLLDLVEKLALSKDLVERLALSKTQ